MSTPDVEELLRNGGYLSFRGPVRADWIDEHAHMNVLAYDRMFQEAEEDFFAHHGLTRHYPETGFGYFRLEKHMRHLSELRFGQDVAVTTLLVATDLKRVHMFHQAWNLGTGARAATLEALSTHVDLTARKAVAQPHADLAAGWLATAKAHDLLPRPEGIGRAIAMRRQA